MKRKSVALLLTGFLAFSLMACGKKTETEKTLTSSTEKKVVKIGIANSGNFMGDLGGIAQDKKYFEEELDKIGYKPEYVSFAAAGPAVNEAFTSKQIDFAGYGDLPPVVLKSKGIDISIIGITNSQFQLSVIVQNDSAIKSINDIRGKKVIVGKGTILQNYFNSLLKANNIKESEVQIINAVADAQSTFVGKQADAYVTVDATARLLVQKGSGKIIESTLGNPDLTSQTVFAGRNEYIKDNPDVPVALLKALIRAKEFAQSNPAETYKILAKSGIPEEVIKQTYGFDKGKFSFYNLEITSDSISKLKKLNDFLLDQKLTSKSVDIDKLVDNSYYQKALKELKK